MNITNIKYLYDLISKENFIYFTIYDSKGSPMREQLNDEYTASDAISDLANFLEHNFGVFRIEFRRTKNITASTKIFSYTIENSKMPESENQSIGSFDSSNDYLSIIREKDEKIENLRGQMMSELIASLNKQHELQIDLIKQSMDKKSDNNDAMIASAIGALSNIFGGGANIGVSGITEELTPVKKETMSKPMDSNKAKINNAVVRLIELDSDFANNITKLADLAENEPLIYKMAIAKLESL